MRNRVSRIFLGDKVRNPCLDFLGCDSRKHHCPKPRHEMWAEHPLMPFFRSRHRIAQPVLIFNKQPLPYGRFSFFRAIREISFLPVGSSSSRLLSTILVSDNSLVMRISVSGREMP